MRDVLNKILAECVVTWTYNKTASAYNSSMDSSKRRQICPEQVMLLSNK